MYIYMYIYVYILPRRVARLIAGLVVYQYNSHLCVRESVSVCVEGGMSITHTCVCMCVSACACKCILIYTYLNTSAKNRAIGCRGSCQ